MTQTKTKKEDLFLIFNDQGTMRLKKTQGQQLIDSPEVYYSKISNGNYNLIHKPSGLLIIEDSNKKSLFAQWENKIKEKFERLDLNAKWYREHFKKFEQLKLED